MTTVFSRLAGATQGRIAPVNAVPPDGSFVFCLGSDLPGAFERIVSGDAVVLSQAADITALGIVLVRFTATLRAPAALPTSYLDTADGSTHAAGLRWVFSWLVGSAVYGSRELSASRTVTIRDGALDVSRLTGVQTIKFSLAAVSP